MVVLTTHPIQYITPWYRALAADTAFDIEVIFLREPTPIQQGVGFGVPFVWDSPLREGYRNAVLGLPSGWRGMLGSLKTISHALSSRKPEVLMITGWNEALLALSYPIARIMGIPVIVRGEANDLRLRSPLVRLLHRVLLSLVDAAVVIGRGNRRFYLKNHLDQARIFSGAYFVDTHRMLGLAGSHSDQRADLRQKYGFSESDFVFAFVGKHVPFKRPHLLVDAASLCHECGQNVKLLFAGSGEMTNSLRDRAQKLGVETVFTGFLNQSEMWKAYIPVDAFVLPSNTSETWGLVTNEAMLFGLPVIVCEEVGCSEDLVIEGETGYTFNGSVQHLAEVMMKLCSDKRRAAAMGLAGRRHVTEHYSMDIASEGLRSAVASVCSRTATRDV